MIFDQIFTLSMSLYLTKVKSSFLANIVIGAVLGLFFKWNHCCNKVNKNCFNQVKSFDFAQSWTALFRAFSSHRQPSASDSWGLPMRAKSSKQRCPALCILDLSYNVKYHWSCRIGGCYGHLTASGSWHGFPGVDHEGRQDIAALILWSNFHFCNLCNYTLLTVSCCALFCSDYMFSSRTSNQWTISELSTSNVWGNIVRRL